MSPYAIGIPYLIIKIVTKLYGVFMDRNKKRLPLKDNLLSITV